MLPKHYVFNHIPKTGGTSLLAVCRANLEPADISPHLEDSAIRLLHPGRIEPYKLIRGHFSILTQSKLCRSRYSMTILRDPIRRIFSTYNFWRTEPDDPLTAKAKQMPFADFVRYFADSPAIIRNSYTYHLAALGRDWADFPADESGLLDAAKRNLSAFNFVGICEEFERSVSLLCAELGWPLPAEVPHQNRSSSEEHFGGVDSETLEVLRDRNRIDIALYDYAKSLLEARGAAQRVELNRFVPFPAPAHRNRRAAIHSVTANWVEDETLSILEIAAEFQTHVPIPDLGLFVQVSDARGEVVWVTSTADACLQLAYEPDRICRARYLVECALPRGIYFLTAALYEAGRLGFYDHWIDHATSFTVPADRGARSRYIRGIRLREFSSVVRRD